MDEIRLVDVWESNFTLVKLPRPDLSLFGNEVKNSEPEIMLAWARIILSLPRKRGLSK
jgi:hypothetical protein